MRPTGAPWVLGGASGSCPVGKAVGPALPWALGLPAWVQVFPACGPRGSWRKAGPKLRVGTRCEQTRGRKQQRQI